jgi:chorismate mutase
MNALPLEEIARKLESLEETIVFKLIDRAQFRVNARVYEPGRSGLEGEDKKSLFEVRLGFQEAMDAQFGRFRVPEERPFTPGLPPSRREVLISDTGLYLDDLEAINLTKEITGPYLALLGEMCAPGDDGQYGSSVEHDVYALQAVSRRVHYGALYVAESKYRADPLKYGPLIAAGDTEAIGALLTRREVEEAILARVSEKVAYAQGRVNREIRRVIGPELVLRFYRDCIIPLTKKGETLYLLNRKNHGI